MDSNKLPEEFNENEFKSYLLKLKTVLNNLTKAYDSNDITDYDVISNSDRMRITFKDAENYKLLSEVQKEINTFGDNYEKLCESGDPRLILHYKVYESKQLRNSVNHLHHLMTTLDTAESFQVQHYVFCIRSSKDQLIENLQVFDL